MKEKSKECINENNYKNSTMNFSLLFFSLFLNYCNKYFFFFKFPFLNCITLTYVIANGTSIIKYYNECKHN